MLINDLIEVNKYNQTAIDIKQIQVNFTIEYKRFVKILNELDTLKRVYQSIPQPPMLQQHINQVKLELNNFESNISLFINDDSFFDPSDHDLKRKKTKAKNQLAEIVRLRKEYNI